jgi:Cd2+/Zn2+-exporting ATPase
MSDNSEQHGCSACGADVVKSGRETTSHKVNASAGKEDGTTLRVAGMDCADEVETVERALTPLSGVRDVRVNLMAERSWSRTTTRLRPNNSSLPSARPG